MATCISRSCSSCAVPAYSNYAFKVQVATIIHRLEPIMLKNLPIIPSRTSQIFYPLFLIYSQSSPLIPLYSFNFTGSVKIMSKCILILETELLMSKE